MRSATRWPVSVASSDASPARGAWNGATIFDDYGHHPVEIAAVLKAARASTEGKVIAIVQPHRHTRLKALFGRLPAPVSTMPIR